jgi:hypothetical protein
MGNSKLIIDQIKRRNKIGNLVPITMMNMICKKKVMKHILYSYFNDHIDGLSKEAPSM